MKYGLIYLFQQIMHIKQMQVGISQKFRRHKMDINKKGKGKGSHQLC